MGNKIVNAELYAHIKRHCGEIARALQVADRLRDDVEKLEQQVAVMKYRNDLMDRRMKMQAIKDEEAG